MRVLKAIFSVLTIVFGSLGLINIVSTDITLPLMFVFMGLTFLTSAKECYDKGAKKDAMIFAGVAIFVYVVTAYNLISRFMWIQICWDEKSYINRFGVKRWFDEWSIHTRSNIWLE